jgi:hypothetical protein
METSSTEASNEKFLEVHPTCAHCPFMRRSKPGWFGPYTRDYYVQAAHTERYVQCHATTGTGKERHCTGVALYRHLCQKRPRAQREREHQQECVSRYGTKNALDRITFMDHHTDEACAFYAVSTVVIGHNE